MLALILDDAEMNNLLMVQALKPVADCEPVTFTCPEKGRRLPAGRTRTGLAWSSPITTCRSSPASM